MINLATGTMSLKRMFSCFPIGSSSSGAAEVPEDLLIRPSSSSGAAEDLPVRSSSEIPKDLVIEIPDDLLIEILSRVPANLVTKFSRLSKFHRGLIDSPDFIRKHYKRTGCSHIIVAPNTRSRYWRDSKTDYQVVRLDPTKFGARVEKSINSFKENGYSVVDSRVGILCLLFSPEAGRDEDDHILLWNPLTEGHRIIDGVQNGNDFLPSFFLGHDAATDDLKILKISHKDPFSNHGISEYHCEIYSYGTGSWRTIRNNGNNELMLFSWHHSIFIEGTNSLHTVDLIDKGILTFDFCLEKFNRIALPPECSVFPDKSSLLDLDGCLCIGGFGMPCEASTSPCWSVWGMKEYGVKESWSWLFCVHDFVQSLFPVPLSLQFVNGGRQLLVLSSESGQHEVRLYDVEDKERIKYNSGKARCSLYRPPKYFVYIPSLRQVRPE